MDMEAAGYVTYWKYVGSILQVPRNVIEIAVQRRLLSRNITLRRQGKWDGVYQTTAGFPVDTTRAIGMHILGDLTEMKFPTIIFCRQSVQNSN